MNQGQCQSRDQNPNRYHNQNKIGIKIKIRIKLTIKIKIDVGARLVAVRVESPVVDVVHHPVAIGIHLGTRGVPIRIHRVVGKKIRYTIAIDIILALERAAAGCVERAAVEDHSLAAACRALVEVDGPVEDAIGVGVLKAPDVARSADVNPPARIERQGVDVGGQGIAADLVDPEDIRVGEDEAILLLRGRDSLCKDQGEDEYRGAEGLHELRKYLPGQ